MHEKTCGLLERALRLVPVAVAHSEQSFETNLLTTQVIGHLGRARRVEMPQPSRHSLAVPEVARTLYRYSNPSIMTLQGTGSSPMESANTFRGFPGP
jgi:hypothetical protein